MFNKKGFMGIVFFFLLLFTILIVGFIATLALGIVDFTSDTVTPIMTDLGVVGSTNLSEVGGYTFGTVNTIVNALPWVMVFAYVSALIFSIVFVVSWTYNPNPMFIGIYFMFIILLIFGAIIISNIYQDLYTGHDEIATELQEQKAMSYMILHSPWIFTVLAFIVGIYLFAGKQMEMQGGFDV